MCSPLLVVGIAADTDITAQRVPNFGTLNHLKIQSHTEWELLPRSFHRGSIPIEIGILCLTFADSEYSLGPGYAQSEHSQELQVPGITSLLQGSGITQLFKGGGGLEFYFL
jgi:hypothetical protein